MPTATAKKVVAKKAVKKVAPKKRVSSARSLVEAEAAQAFWVTDGQILHNLRALADALASMSAASFAHHVSKSRNDFADWVEAVLADASCAAAMRKAKTQKGVCTVVVKSLKSYG